MRAQLVATLVRIGLLLGAALLFLFLWAGTGSERAPLGLLIGITVGGLAGLAWMEMQLRKVLEKVKEAEA